MASLESKDSYIQKLTSKICAKQNKEPRKRTFVPFKGVGNNGPPNKKKNKNKGKHKGGNGKLDVHEKTAPKPIQKPLTRPVQKGATIPKLNGAKTTVTNGTVTGQQKGMGGGKAGSECSPVDALRQRLHEKIEASRGQGTPKDPSSEVVQAKRAKRKMERERKKRKRKEFKMKKQLADKEAAEQELKKEAVPVAVAVAGPTPGKRDETAIVFNKVEMVEDRYVDKQLKKKEKKKSVKGNLTPLTGKNYKQLLGRVEARKAKLEHLKETDEGKAREMEEKMKWTNVLYKAEGLKIKDDEDMLRASLKRKERMRTQRKKRWDDRSQAVVEKMKRGQDKRRRNLQKQKKGKMEKQKDRARKKGRILPEDLKKASV